MVTWISGTSILRNLKERLKDLKEELREQVSEQRDVIHDAVMKANEEVKRARDDVRRGNGEVKVMSRDGPLRTTKIDLGKAQIVFSDDKGEMKIETVDGKKVLTAKDPQGKLLFSGPVETKEELDKVPAEIRQRYETLKQNDLPAVAPAPDADEDESGDTDDDDDKHHRWSRCRSRLYLFGNASESSARDGTLVR